MQKENRLLDLLREMEEQGIDENDIRQNRIFSRVLNYKYRENHIPESGVMELTPLCNLDCKMCYVHLRPEQMEERTVLRGEQWIAWIDDAVDQGMLSVELTGGEAMLHPDFDDIYLHLLQKGVRVTVMTNGILLNDKRIAFFCKYPPAAIQITLYGASEETYETVTGKSMYGKVMHNLRKAKEIGCHLGISITPSRYFGVEDAKKIRAFTQKEGMQLTINNDLNEPRGDTGRSLSQFSLELDEYIRIHKGLQSVATETVSLTQVPEPGTAQEEQRGLLCSAGRSMFCITWEGFMKMCFDLPESVDLKEISFHEAWNKLYALAEFYLIPRECGNCAYQEACNRCPAIHMQNAPLGHADRHICHRTRCMAAEGLIRWEEKNEV